MEHNYVLHTFNILNQAMSTENTEKVKDWLTHKFINDDLNSEDMVQIIEHAGMLIQLRKISDAAKEYGKSYNGIKRFSKTIRLFGYKFTFK